jgi:NAD(P)H-hydrate repair Nnr-like enzyme with NAD(P)H-hydrate epimerase domain
MLKRITPAAVVAAAIGLAACGSGSDGGDASIAPETAKTRVEQAVKVKLAETPIPQDARDQGLRAAYSNAATVPQDKQVVGLFVMKDEGVADKVSEMVRSSAPASAKLIVHDEVMVVYADTGKDRGTALEKAVNSL